MEINQPVEAGQAVYTKTTLSMYDLWVLGFSNSYLWNCPTSILRTTFVEHASLNHLDVGVGSGYYPDKCLSNTKRRVALLDLNQDSLTVASERISRFNPEVYCDNVLELLNTNCESFDSISVNYLLHCLPGSIREKGIIFHHLREFLNENGVLFGSTILGKDSKYGYLAGKLMAFYNSKGIFDNAFDDLHDLEISLKQNFTDVKINVIGCVAIFSGRKI
jgi:2-polyprenyl-3-methyl-5-hydroxy-6-metoxy-1,4-benzoquinol methylase